MGFNPPEDILPTKAIAEVSLHLTSQPKIYLAEPIWRMHAPLQAFQHIAESKLWIDKCPL